MYELSSDLSQNGAQVATQKTREPEFSLKDKKSKFLQQSDLRSRSTNFKPSLTEEVSRNQLEFLILIILLKGVSNPGEINYYFKKKISEQNRDLRETCIRNMRDMEELQKSHVLKVEELSRRKLTEDFEAVTWFFQGSNVKTVYKFGDNDAKYPDAEIDDVHTRNSLASPLYLQEWEASASLFQAFTHQEKACFNVYSQLSTSSGKPVTGCHWKRKSNQELDNCQIRIIFGKTREQLLADAKPEILRHEYRADLAENNICDLKRRIESQAVEIGHTRTGYEQSRREQALLHEELADRERALRDARIRSIQKLDELKSDLEFRLEEFSRRRLVENHFKDVDSVRSGQLLHVPNQPTLFPLPREPGGLPSSD